MTHQLYFPPCIHDPPHPLHPPPYDKPLRICAFAPLSAIEKIIPGGPDLAWNLQPITKATRLQFQPCALLLATLVHRTIYGTEPNTQQDVVVRHECIGPMNPEKPNDVIYRGKAEGLNTYTVTFDHLVPHDDQDPDTLQIIIFETEYDDAAFAKMFLRRPVDPQDYAPHRNRVLATYRCCDNIDGSDDRSNINLDVRIREASPEDVDAIYAAEGIHIMKEVTRF